MSATTALEKLSKAEAWLAEAKSLEDLKEIHDIARAAEAYAKALDLGVEAENHAVEIRLLAARRIGELVPATPLDEAGRQGGRGKEKPAEVRRALEIPHQRLSEFRKLAQPRQTLATTRRSNLRLWMYNDVSGASRLCRTMKTYSDCADGVDGECDAFDRKLPWLGPRTQEGPGLGRFVRRVPRRWRADRAEVRRSRASYRHAVH